MPIRVEFNEWGFNPEITGRFGLEMETEVYDEMDFGDLLVFDPDQEEFETILPSTWKAVADHSLRNCGVEFVLRKPLDFHDAVAALDDFESFTSDIPFIKNAPGTSTHVHVNFLDEEITTLANFITLWTLFENILIEYSGESRRANLFALPARVAEGVTYNLREFLKSLRNDFIQFPKEQMAKYGAINVCPLNRYGSIEIRCFRGTSDVEEIKKWLRVLDHLVEASRSFADPYECLEAWRAAGIELIYDVFLDMADELLEDIDDPVFYVERNLLLAMRLATAQDDWSDIDTARSSRFKPRKKKSLTPTTNFILQDEAVLNIQPSTWAFPVTGDEHA